MYLVNYVTTMNNSVELFLQQGSFRSNLSRARYIWSDVLHVTLGNYIGVRNWNVFFICDVFGQMCHNCVAN